MSKFGTASVVLLCARVALTPALSHAEPPPHANLSFAKIEVESYHVDARVGANLELELTSTASLRRLDAGRALAFELAAALEVVSAEVTSVPGKGWQPVEIAERADSRARGVVLLPADLTADAFEVRLAVRGKGALLSLGGTRFSPAPGGPWYPVFGEADPAAHTLRLTAPAEVHFVAAGAHERSAAASGFVTTTVADAVPRPTVGFVGHREEGKKSWFRQGSPGFLLHGDSLSQMNVRVIDASLGPIRTGVPATGWQFGSEGRGQPPTLRQVPTGTGGSSGALVSANPGSSGLGSPILAGRGRAYVSRAEADNLQRIHAASEVCSALFGPLPSRLEVVAVDLWSTDLHWPSLLAVPYNAGVIGPRKRSTAQGARWTLEPVESAVCEQSLLASLAPPAPQDEWLAVGLSELAAALAVERVSGPSASAEFFRAWKSQLFKPAADATPAGGAAIAAGSLTDATTVGSDAAATLLPGKGAFVFHMLRLGMDPQSRGSSRFETMVRELVESRRGGRVSTADLKAAVERHIVPDLNATGDGTMDWFFDQWVHGSEIPRLTHTLTVQKAGKGRYRLTGKVAMSEVSAGFRALVPIYLDFGKDRQIRVASVPLVGPTSREVDLTLELPRKPVRALINAREDVLARP